MSKRYFEKNISNLDNPNSLESKVGIKTTKLGFLPIPKVLLRFRKDLKLTYWDLLFVGYIFAHKQNYEWPYISLAKITRDYKVSQDTINKSVKRLKKLHFLTTTPRKKDNPKGKGRNIYDLSMLVACLEHLIDQKPDAFFGTDKWTQEDYSDFAFLKSIEKEKYSENQRDTNAKSEEHNK